MNPLGTTVAALRAENGWTQQELARRITRAGTTVVRYQSVQQLENTPHMRPRYLIQLATAFGKTVEELQNWAPGMPKYGPNVRAHGVREPKPDEYSGVSLTEDEIALLDDYRACNKRARDALRVLASCSRTRA
jgi:transcriptional regulator with XRE-family HTH domain